MANAPRVDLIRIFLLGLALISSAVASTSASAIIPAGGSQDPAEPAKDVPAVAISNGAGGGCSATVIGPRTLITAGHCVAGSALSDIFQISKDRYHASVKIHSGEILALNCEPHPLWQKRIGFDLGRAGPEVERAEFDIALCQSARDLDSSIARISFTSKELRRGSTVYFFGFGCRQRGGTDRSFGILSTGRAKVVDIMPVSTDPGQGGWMETGGAALCFGDAGAGVYIDAANGRALVGVGSRGDLSSRSWVSLTAAPTISKWIRDWSSRHDADLCSTDDEIGCSQYSNRPHDPAESLPTVAAKQRLDTTVVANAPLEQPTIVVTSLQGDTISRIVQRTCGPVLNSYFDTLAAILSPTLAARNIDTPILAKTEIKLLPCPPRLTAPFVVRDLDDATRAWGPWEWYLLALKENKGAWTFFGPPDGVNAGAPNFLDTFQSLNREDDPQFDAHQPGKSALKRLKIPTSPPALPTVSLAVSYQLGTIKPVFEINPTPDQCGPSSLDPASYPYNVLELQGVIARNLPPNTDLGKVSTDLVLVADTGLDGIGTGPFQKTILIDSERSDYASRVSPILPKSGSEDWLHGTAVASLILGGPKMIQGTLVKGLIKLKIEQIYASVYDRGNTKNSVQPSEFTKILRSSTAQFVNLSVEGDGLIEIVPFVKNGNEGPLFIVAAGNESDELVAN